MVYISQWKYTILLVKIHYLKIAKFNYFKQCMCTNKMVYFH